MPADATHDPDNREARTDQPGLSRLRDVVMNHSRMKLPPLGKLRRDAIAGLGNAVSNVPDGMANGVLLSVSPIHGLYAVMAGTVVGGWFTSTHLMIISTTAAASLTAAGTLEGLSGEARTGALLILVVLIGVFQVIFGLLGFGRLFRFVPYSVTTGFLSGVAVLLTLSQLPTITSYPATGDNNIVKTVDLFSNLDRISLPSLLIATLTLVLVSVLPRTPLRKLGRLAGIAIPSAMVVLLGLDGVDLVRDSGAIPRGLPLPGLPTLSAITPDIVTGALAVAVVILIQGEGVSQSVPNPDGSHRSTSRNFIAQGAANVASGFFQGAPVGGSLSATTLSLMYGAQSRWAAILTGIFIALILSLFPVLVGFVALPALGALLIIAGVSSINRNDIQLVWNTSWTSRLCGACTFLAMLFLPIQAAVGIGVMLSAVLYVNRSSTDVTLVELVELPDGRLKEQAPPKKLPSNRITILDVYGHLFYAGAQTFERRLPLVEGSQRPVVVLRLRKLRVSGATLQDVLSGYADKLGEAGGKLYLSGVRSEVHDQFIRAGRLRLDGPVEDFEATPIRGESTRRALADAQAWLVAQKGKT